MNSLCLFAAYIEGPDLPYYVRVYLSELRRHATDLVFLSSQHELSESARNFLKEQRIELQLEKNEGFDFGLWYKALMKREVGAYDRLLLVNDSCVLFSSLDKFMTWCEHDEAAINGMTQSDAIAPHLQSYFLVIKKQAIAITLEYFQRHKLLKKIQEVISTYEVGLSKHWQSNGHKIRAFVSNQIQGSEFSPYFLEVKWHLQQGLPLLKKKILYSSYRKDELFTLARMDFDIAPETYINLVKTSGIPLLISFEDLMRERGRGMSAFVKWRYGLTRFLIRFYKKLRHGR